jgi:hypothetical protein
MQAYWIWLLLSMSIYSTWSNDTLYAYQCNNLVNSKYISHQDCLKHMDTLEKKQFSVVQTKSASKLSGFSCVGHKTTEVDFCGAYSHSKHSGQSTFHIPILFNKETCTNMAKNRVYTTPTQSFPLAINYINTFNSYTHGGVKYTGTNIGCTGETLRLLDGSLNSNMIKQDHYTIIVNEVDLMNINNEVLNPTTQTVLGPIATEHAYSGSTTYIWYSSPPKCNLMRVLDVELESVSPGVWFNHLHKIQIDSLETYHDQDCDIRVTKTTSKDIFLVELPQPISNMDDINSMNVDISIDIQIRFQYLYTQVSNAISLNYKSLDPLCDKIRSNPISSTIRVDNNMFLRNLGDVSVQFECKMIQVAPSPDDIKCYSMLPVQDLTGNVWFLDPSTRILMKKAIELPCSPANTPVYKTNEGEMVSFSPKRRIIVVHKSVYNGTDDGNSGGLYPTEMISEWLSYAFLQHLSIHSYALFSQSICQSSECKTVHNNPSSMINYMGGALKNLSALAKERLWLGIDIEKLGAHCSIFICLLLTVYTLYAVAAWAIRFSLFRQENLQCCALICRTTWPSFFLIAKSNNENNGNNV